MQFPRPGRLLLWAVLFVFLAPMVVGIPASLWLSWRLDPVQSFYFGPYLASALEGGTKGMLSTVRYAEKTAPGRKSEMLLPGDAVAGKSSQRLALSPKALAEGWQGVSIGPPQKVRPLELEAYLRETFFEGDSAWLMLLRPVLYELAAVLLFYALRLQFGQGRRSREHEERHGRRTKGPELVAGLGRFLRSNEDGIQLRMQGRGLLPGGSYHISKRLESSHILLLGDTGSGKSSAIRQILRQVRERGESAIVNDPAMDFIGEFYDPERDLILNPLDARCPYWSLGDEIDYEETAATIAAAMLPEKEYEKHYFTEAPRRVLAHLLKNKPQPRDLLRWMSDRRQHEAVEAGKPFAQLQEAGMKTISLDQIVRQKDPELRHVVEQLARGEVGAAVKNLESQGRVHEFRGRDERMDAIAKEYAKSPENTLVVSPDNRSRAEINGRIHAELQSRGVVSQEAHRVRTLVPRQDLTGAARTWAERYEVGDVLRYSRASKETGIGKGEYARVVDVDGQQNRLTVELKDGRQQSYDPRRQSGVSVYREEERAFSKGDRIQFSAPANELKVANRELGTVEGISEGRMALRMDDGRSVTVDSVKHPHLDHGYAVTSHSSQGQTAERVLVHVDTELGAKDLLNNRMAYVAVSRGAHDAQLFTNDREKLPIALGHEVSQKSAHVPQVAKVEAPEIAPKQERGYDFGISM